MRCALGRDALEDLDRVWPAITLVAAALLVYGDLSREQIIEILPEAFPATAKQIFDARFDRWYAV